MILCVHSNFGLPFHFADLYDHDRMLEQQCKSASLFQGPSTSGGSNPGQSGCMNEKAFTQRPSRLPESEQSSVATLLWTFIHMSLS